MGDNFKVTFMISPFQEFEPGSLVTYRDEKFLGYLKDNLYSRSDFFYIQNNSNESDICKISNGIDSVETSTDQLIELVAYLEKTDRKSDFGNNRLENIIKWQSFIDSSEFLIIEDQKMAIFLEDRIIEQSFFYVDNRIINVDLMPKKYQVAVFKEDRIPDLI